MRRPKKILLKLKQIVEYRRIARSGLEKRSLKQSRFLERAASFDRDFEPVGGLAGASKDSPNAYLQKIRRPDFSPTLRPACDRSEF